MSEELAWAAGFFDGEGCFSWRKTRDPRGKVLVTITQVDPEVLEKFKAAVGVGNVLGPYNRRPDDLGQRPYWLYRVQGRGATKVALDMWPWLGTVKRLQYNRVVDRVKNGG